MPAMKQKKIFKRSTVRLQSCRRQKKENYLAMAGRAREASATVCRFYRWTGGGFGIKFYLLKESVMSMEVVYVE
jgi:hypothetical protein